MSTAHAGPGSATAWMLAALLTVVPLLAYRHGVRVRREHGRGWPAWRATGFGAGLVLVAAAVSPLAAGHDPRVHMAQHLLLGMLAPVALVLGAPVTLLLGALPPTGRRRAAAVLRSRVVHVLTHPVAAAALDIGALFLLYLTPLYALTAAHPLAHRLVGLHFLLAGCLFAWSIAGPDPAPHRPGIAVRAAVLVLAGAAHGYLAKLLYAQAAALPPGAAHDVVANEAAARLMYYGGDLAEAALAIALFATWYRRRAAQPLAPPAASSRRGLRSG